MNRITGIIPTYNPIKQWLQQTLDSCVGFDELIICDDGSDNFNERQYKLSKDVPTVFIHNKTNIGCFNTINVLCNQVKEGFITIQADDDFYDKQNLPAIIEKVKLTDADIIYFPCQYFGKYNFLFGNAPKVEYKTLLQANYVYGSAFFRKELWTLLKGFQLSVAGDWDFWIRAIKSGARFEFYPAVGAHFRVSQRSMFENSLATVGRNVIEQRVRDNATKWEGRYEKEKVHI